ncbi:olfactory receptor 6C76-like [Tachyglossus aculeatus]|uniref:olfactory receptor 6C76-like n=1 Tax=Tachyglossus aculeatus TaxID=9261 RepID=UPI0018F2E3CF|nr:olfactory receptor 6C76-like [Tachyglossus aculeatus]
MRNGTGVTEFILMGFFDNPQLQAPLFFILFLTYALSVTGNLTIVTLTLLYSHLRTHMYFFLARDGLHVRLHSQIPAFLHHFLGGDEFFLLAAMSYYRYIVICQPLHYTAVMNKGFSLLLNTRLLELIAFLLALGTLLVTLALVTKSYLAIIHNILRLPSAQQRSPFFSVELAKGAAVFNTSVTSMTNPFIYTLMDEQVKQAFRALVHQGLDP